MVAKVNSAGAPPPPPPASSPSRPNIIVPPNMVVTSPGRIAAAGSTELFDEPVHVVHGTSKPSEVYDMIANGSWSQLASRILEEPTLAAQWIGQEGSGHSDWKRLPIHEACIKGASYKTIQVLIDACPSSLEQKDHAGRVPLHHACCYGQSREAIELLLMECPDAINMTDKWGRTPLMAAEFSSTDSRGDALELLSKGSKYHDRKKLELMWTQKEDQKNKVVTQEHENTVQRLKERIIAAEEQANETEFALKAQLESYQDFLNQIDTLLGIQRIPGSPRKSRSRIQPGTEAFVKQLVNEKSNVLDEFRQESEQTKASFEAEIETLNAELAQMGSDKQGLSEKLSRETNDKLAVARTLELTAKEAKDFSATIDLQREKIASLEQNVADLMASKADLEERVASLTSNLEDRNAELAEKKETFKDVDLKLTQAAADLSMEQAKNAQLTSEVADKNKAVESMEAEISGLSQELEEAMKTYETLEGHISSLQSGIEKLDKELKDTKASKDRVAAELEEKKRSQKEMQNIVAATLASEASMKEKVDRYEARLTNMSNETSDLREEISSSREELRRLRQNEKQYNGQVRILEERIAEDSEIYEDEKLVWSKTRQALEESCRSMEGELQQLRIENEGLSKQVEDSNSRVMVLGNAAQEARLQVSRTLATITAQKEAVEHQAAEMKEAYEAERSEFVDRIAHLETQMRSVDREMTNGTIKSVSAFEALEEALEVAAKENAKILRSIASSHKKHLSIKTTSPRKSRSPKKSPRKMIMVKADSTSEEDQSSDSC